MQTESAPAILPIRPLGLGQLPEILDFRLLMMQECGLADKLRADWRPPTEEHYARLMREGLSLHHGAFDGERLVGTAGAMIRTQFPFSTMTHTAGWIMDVYVLPDYRGRRLAGQLTQACVDWLLTRGATDIRLAASVKARECQLYEKLGFVAGAEMRLAAPPGSC